MKDEEEFEDKYGDEPDGAIGNFIKFGADEDKYMFMIEPTDTMIEQTEDEESYDGLAVIAKIFKDVLKRSARKTYKKKIDASKIRICIELPKDVFAEEWKTACEESPIGGAFFKVSDEDVENNLTRIIPEVLVDGESVRDMEKDNGEEEGDE